MPQRPAAPKPHCLAAAKAGGRVCEPIGPWRTREQRSKPIRSTASFHVVSFSDPCAVSRSRRPRKPGCMKWLERINGSRRFALHVPFEETYVDPVRQKVGNGKTVLLDGRDFFSQVDVRRRSGAEIGRASC